MDIQLEKSRLRDKITDHISAMSDDDRAKESKSVCHKLRSSLDDIIICAFSPLAHELDIQPLLQDILKEGQSLFLPRTEEGSIVFRRCENLSTLITGSYGVQEPSKDSEKLSCDGGQIIALVPGLAFDSTGGRLGRGRGYYDRWIRAMRGENKNTQFFGVCFGCQIVSQVPIEEHDEHVDVVITAR